MLSYLKKILSYDPPEPFVLGESPDEQHEAPQESHIRAKEQKAQYPAFTLSKKLEDMYTQLRRIFGNGENDDLILRIFKAGEKRVFLALLDGLTNKDMTGEIIMKPLMTNGCTSLTQALEAVSYTHLEVYKRQVFFSTHVLEVAEKLCDRIAIINHGRILSLIHIWPYRHWHGAADG